MYLRWQELEAGVGELVAGRSAWRWSTRPGTPIPYIGRVDAGTIEVVRAFGVEVVSSGDLIQRFEATWDDEQWAMHREAAKHCTTRPTTWPSGFIADADPRRRAIDARPRSRPRSWSTSATTD